MRKVRICTYNIHRYELGDHGCRSLGLASTRSDKVRRGLKGEQGDEMDEIRWDEVAGRYPYGWGKGGGKVPTHGLAYEVIKLGS